VSFFRIHTSSVKNHLREACLSFTSTLFAEVNDTSEIKSATDIFIDFSSTDSEDHPLKQKANVHHLNIPWRSLRFHLTFLVITWRIWTPTWILTSILKISLPSMIFLRNLENPFLHMSIKQMILFWNFLMIYFDDYIKNKSETLNRALPLLLGDFPSIPPVLTKGALLSL